MAQTPTICFFELAEGDVGRSSILSFGNGEPGGDPGELEGGERVTAVSSSIVISL